MESSYGFPVLFLVHVPFSLPFGVLRLGCGTGGLAGLSRLGRASGATLFRWRRSRRRRSHRGRELLGVPFGSSLLGRHLVLRVDTWWYLVLLAGTWNMNAKLPDQIDFEQSIKNLR